MSAPRPPSPDGLPVLGNAVEFATDPFNFVGNAVDQCGDSYRMVLPGANDVYVLCHPDFYEQVLVDDVDSFNKTADFRAAFGNGLLSSDGETWRSQRQILQPLFYRGYIQKFVDQMVTCTERRLDTWQGHMEGDIEQEMKDLTFEILFSTLFGEVIGPGERGDLRNAADDLNEWFVPASWMLPNWVPTPARRRFKQSKAVMRDEVKELLAERQASPGSDDTDLLSQLFDAQESNPDLATEEIEEHLMTMVFAGYETTATALAFTWYNLATHSSVREDFETELEEVLGGDSPSIEDIGELEVTDRILKETLRLHPPIHTLPRQTTREMEMRGIRVPKGKEVHLSVIHTHRDDQFYDDPEEYRPERWSNGFEDDLHDFAYIPFGAGRRACIGREFALLEAKIVLATIGQQYRFEDQGHPLEIEPEITIKSKDGVLLSAHEKL